MKATIIPIGEEAAGWERALYAFLAEKERRSGSRRTVEGYSRTLQHFFGTMGKPPDKVTSQEVFAWAYGKGLSGKEPAAITIGARLACLSSFYRFLIRMEIVAANPCDQIERAQALAQPAAGDQRRGDKEADRRRPRDAGRSAGPSHHPHTCPHWPAPGRGLQPEGRRSHSNRWLVLHLPTGLPVLRRARQSLCRCRSRISAGKETPPGGSLACLPHNGSAASLGRNPWRTPRRLESLSIPTGGVDSILVHSMKQDCATSPGLTACGSDKYCID